MFHMSGNRTADSSRICWTRTRGMNDTVDVVILCEGREYFPDAVRSQEAEVTEGRRNIASAIRGGRGWGGGGRL